MDKLERIRVAVRVRPLSSRGDPSQEVVSCSPDGESVFVYADPARKQAASFQCETYLPSTMAQDEIFDAINARELILSALDGFPVTIFAYGQTGAGKSFTIFGKEDGSCEKKLFAQSTDGILPRTAVELMTAIEERSQEVEYTLRVTCVEIYNEQVRDLFDPRKESLAVRSTAEHGFFLENATVMECVTAKEIVRVVKMAALNRMKSSHQLNDQSNRSHCLVTIYIDSNPLDSENGVKKYGKLTIVDLAGSERASDTGAVGTQLKETGHINKSLYCLSQVIQALSSKTRSKFVPFRDSKLTMVSLVWLSV